MPYTKDSLPPVSNETTGQWVKYEELDKGAIDLSELWNAFWQGKWIVLVVTAIFSVSSVFYALSLSNTYRSEVLLAPVEQEGRNIASQFGSIASLAGISLGGGGKIDKSSLALEIMKSRAFITSVIEKNNLLAPLMASKGWDKKTDRLIYDEEVYSIKEKKWLPGSKIPSLQEAFKAFKNIMLINQDETSGLITISVTHLSPRLSKEWLDLIVNSINDEMKERDLNEARKTIDYVELQLKGTVVNELRNILYQIIEEKTKTIMFAEVRNQYVLETIDPAIEPEKKYGPKRALICLFGTFMGAVLGLFVVLIYFFRKKRN